MDADRRAPVYEVGEIVVGARRDVVWDTLTDLKSWPQWMPGVKTMEVGQPVGVGTKFTWKAGANLIHSEIVESDRPASVGWKGRTMGIEAVHVWRLEERGGDTRVVTEESWSGLLAA